MPKSFENLVSMKLFNDDILGELMPVRAFDENIRKEHKKKYLIGIDEAGRGPLASFICAAAIVLKPSAALLDVRDSKKYASRDKREKAWNQIKDHLIFSATSLISANEIDKIGIHAANAEAMKMAALSALGDERDVVILLDGNPLWSGDLEGMPCVWIESADNKSLNVAVASVMAKVKRDRIMVELSIKYPQYGFDEHMGYGTNKHFEAIRKYGIIEGVHRRCFLTKMLDEN